ncbi:MAG TPA: DUF4113 domain-containing protein, partial [Ferruginibacter sp.]|nr:DUF4113 domain-containing protein [Ferruginibacter sp.]
VALVTPEQIRYALENTPVRSLWGVGFRSSEKLKMFGINTGWQLRNMSGEWANKHLGGVVGTRLIKELHGEPCIQMRDPLENKKMIATTRMFGKPVTAISDLKEAVATYTTRAAEKLRRQYCAASVINVFVVTNDHGEKYEYLPQTKGLYATLPVATSLTNELIGHAIPLVDKLYNPGSRYLKAGVMLSGLVPDDAVQYNLFEPGSQPQLRGLMNAVDNVNFSMRDDVVKFAASGMKKNWKMRQEMRSKRYTTRWEEMFEVK